MAFKAYAFQRLQAENFRGAAAVINLRPAICSGPGVPPGCGLLPLGAPRPKPVIKKPWRHRAPCNRNYHKQQLRGGATHIEHIGLVCCCYTA